MADIYSKLMSRGISVYDRVSVIWNDRKIIGTLLPRYNETSKDVLVIKQDSGYNIGVRVDDDASVTLVSKNETKRTKRRPQQDSVKGKVAVMSCGGTIASKIEYKTGAVYPVSTKSELTELIPEINDISNIAFIEIMGILSEDINPKHWEIITKSVSDAIHDGANGIVLLHGTDTMHYTSAALSFALQNPPVPIVLVGAQRSSDRPSTDSHSNFLNAVFSANQDLGEVAVCMHANINDSFAYLHRGTRVRKMHTSRRDAFKSIDIPPIAEVNYKKNVFKPLLKYNKRHKSNEFKSFPKFNKNVGLIYYYPGMNPEFIKKMDMFDGVVIAGSGLGHVSTNPFNDKHATPIIKEIRDLIASDIPVVMAPQTIYGRLNMNVYTAGRLLIDAGVIGNGADWTPETAYVKLSHTLAYKKGMNEIREYMMRNIAGEITGRSPIL